MKIAKVKLVGVSPYSQSKHYTTPKKDKETADAYERRTWRDRMHVTKDGYVEIPAMSFPNCWRASAARLGIKVPGKRNATYTKSFDSGILVLEPLKLDIKAADVACDELFVPSDGKPGGGSRVTKLFPRIDEWKGEVTFHILDDLIDEKVFRQVGDNAGLLIGIGRFRPQNRGYFGRFRIEAMTWEEASAEAAE